MGGQLLASKVVRRIDPVYPALARQARISGEVILQVLIDEEGSVSDIKVLAGHPLLREAAARAVLQWRYSPTLLNGEPVPVAGTVTVVFRLK
jgi:protein TonB